MSEDKVQVGSRVIPANGRYKGRPMVVVSIRDGYADVCDGRRRRIAKPKRKKISHLVAFSDDTRRLDVTDGTTDGDVRRHLASFAADPDN